jgi:hypothetical protein
MIYRRRKNAMLNNTLRQVPLFAQLKDDELDVYSRVKNYGFHKEKKFILKDSLRRIFMYC